jgi:curved DNA-binding protein
MKFKDYYKIMGVALDATPDQIKTAYRALARKLHPDVNKAKDAQARFSELGEAYEALGDAPKRASYDELRAQGWREGEEFHAPPQGARAGGDTRRGPFAGGGGEGMDADQFSDFFSSLFGQRAGRGRREAGPQRGEDIHHRIEITLEEAFAGGERQLQLQLPPDERGQAVRRSLRVTIPKGLVEGEVFRLRGQGTPGATAELNGNLYLEATIAPHRLFTVDGRTITLDLPLAPWEAVLGAQVSVPTLGGPAQVTVPAGSKDGQMLRLRGRGLPGTPPGDQHVRLRLTVPPGATAKAEELWRELAKESAYDPRSQLGGQP